MVAGHDDEGSGIQLQDSVHVLGRQGEVKNVEVLGHALFEAGLGNDNHAALNEIAESDLRAGLSIFRAVGNERLIGEEAVLALG